MADELIRICGIALICAVGSLLLRNMSGGATLGTVLRIVGMLALVTLVIVWTGKLWSTLSALTDSVHAELMSKYTSAALKALGLAYIASIGSDICRDCGEGTLASCIETAGNIAILMLCVPVFEDLLGYASELLGAS